LPVTISLPPQNETSRRTASGLFAARSSRGRPDTTAPVPPSGRSKEPGFVSPMLAVDPPRREIRPKGVQINPRELRLRCRTQQGSITLLQVRLADDQAVQVHLAELRPQAPDETYSHDARTDRPAPLSHSRTSRFTPTSYLALSGFGRNPPRARRARRLEGLGG
jgi:hypothetical protein